MSSFALFFTVLLLGAALNNGQDLGITCKDHPAHRPGLTPVIVRAWEFVDHVRLNNVRPSMYHPGYTGHTYVPAGSPSSRKYAGLDFFWAAKAARAPSTSGLRHIRLLFQRPAKVYLLVRVNFRHAPRTPARLSGWTSEGYAEILGGRGEMFRYGVHQTDTRFMSSKVSVFSKTVTDEIYIPHTSWISGNFRASGINTGGDWSVLVAETDGSAPKLPTKPPGFSSDILPNTRCPDKLHDMWVTPDNDPTDSDTDGIMWKTWHPQWDPCYWCAYDHEHGSSPLHIMGYAPKYHYTAWKNNRQDESNMGFKGYVFRSGPYFVYYNLHAEMSSLRRVTESSHTIVLVITLAATKEVVVEIQQKGYFGFLAARKAGGGFVPLRREDEIEEARQERLKIARALRTINVINVGNLDRRFEFRQGAVLQGEYEQWTTSTICAHNERFREIRVDIKNPNTGIKSASQLNTQVDLFRVGFRSTGEIRDVRFDKYLVSEDNCLFKLANIRKGMSNDGYFYTDADGEVLLPGPGRDAVRQYIKPGFSHVIDGRFEPVDHWIGLHATATEPTKMQDYGFGLDPDRN